MTAKETEISAVWLGKDILSLQFQVSRRLYRFHHKNRLPFHVLRTLAHGNERYCERKVNTPSKTQRETEAKFTAMDTSLTVSVSMCAVGERMHDHRFVVAARRLHVGGRMRRNFSASPHQIHAGSFRLPARHELLQLTTTSCRYAGDTMFKKLYKIGISAIVDS